jgi:hypothetical protein
MRLSILRTAPTAEVQLPFQNWSLQAWAVLWGMSLGREGHSGVFQAQTGSLDQKLSILRTAPTAEERFWAG